MGLPAGALEDGGEALLGDQLVQSLEEGDGVVGDGEHRALLGGEDRLCKPLQYQGGPKSLSQNLTSIA